MNFVFIFWILILAVFILQKIPASIQSCYSNGPDNNTICCYPNCTNRNDTSCNQSCPFGMSLLFSNNISDICSSASVESLKHLSKICVVTCPIGFLKLQSRDTAICIEREVICTSNIECSHISDICLCNEEDDMLHGTNEITTTSFDVISTTNIYNPKDCSKETFILYIVSGITGALLLFIVVSIGCICSLRRKLHESRKHYSRFSQLEHKPAIGTENTEGTNFYVDICIEETQVQQSTMGGSNLLEDSDINQYAEVGEECKEKQPPGMSRREETNITGNKKGTKSSSNPKYRINQSMKGKENNDNIIRMRDKQPKTKKKEKSNKNSSSDSKNKAKAKDKQAVQIIHEYGNVATGGFNNAADSEAKYESMHGIKVKGNLTEYGNILNDKTDTEAKYESMHELKMGKDRVIETLNTKTKEGELDLNRSDIQENKYESMHGKSIPQPLSTQQIDTSLNFYETMENVVIRPPGSTVSNEEADSSKSCSKTTSSISNKSNKTQVKLEKSIKKSKNSDKLPVHAKTNSEDAYLSNFGLINTHGASTHKTIQKKTETPSIQENSRDVATFPLTSFKPLQEDKTPLEYENAGNIVRSPILMRLNTSTEVEVNTEKTVQANETKFDNLTRDSNNERPSSPSLTPDSDNTSNEDTDREDSQDDDEGSNSENEESSAANVLKYRLQNCLSLHEKLRQRRNVVEVIGKDTKERDPEMNNF